MKKIIALLVVVSLSITAAGCFPFGSIVGRGPVETRSFDFSGFTRVVSASTFEVEIVRDSAFSVIVTTNENLFDYLALERTGDTLQVKLKPGSYTFASLKARITLPDLFSVDLSAASKGVVSGFDFIHELRLKASGASVIELAGIKCGDVTVEVSGASRVRGQLEAGDGRFVVTGASSVDLSGSGRKFDVAATGASNVALRNFATADTKVNFSGASSGSVNTGGRLDVQLSGASSLRYFGNPTLGDVNTSGGSSINKG